jgi:hypothetical protein
MSSCLLSLRVVAFLFALVAVPALSEASEAGEQACGGKNQRPCTIFERIPSCNAGLVEDFSKNRCVAKDVPGRDCGQVNQRPCKVWERVPSCNANLKEDFARGICVAVNCGKKYGRPCTVVQRIPSCDSGLVEDFLKGQCVPSGDAERHRIANAKLVEIGSFIASKVGFATAVASDPQVRAALNSSDKTRVAQVVNASAVGATQMPDGYLLRTLSIGATAGGKILIVGTSGGAGAAIDLKGQRPVYAYATGGYNFGPGLAAGAGIDVGLWVCQNNKIGGDSWGIAFGVDDLAKAYAGASDLKKGPSIGVGLWFDYHNVFQGFTITPGFGVGADFGGLIKATTAVEGDPTVGCDGRPVQPGTSGSLGPKTHIQQITYAGGVIAHGTVANGAPRPDLVRVCLENSTGYAKSITHNVRGVNPLVAPTNGSKSCANFSASLRLNLAFVDRGVVKRRDAMSLQRYAGDTVVFEWQRDR